MTSLIVYFTLLLVIGALDALWLGWLARDFYQRELGPLMAAQVRKLPALLFYLGYPLGLMLLALTPRPETMFGAAGRCALLGLLAYGTYDLTNLATLKGFSTRLALTDLAWGVVISTVAGTAAWWVGGRLR